MEYFRINFVVGVTDDDLHSLQRGRSVISKLLLIPDDYKAFHYSEGDTIQAETPQGHRILTRISNLEIVENEEHVIIILTLTSGGDQKES